MSKNKNATAIALILILATTLLFAIIPNVKATEWDTFIHQSATPNPIGVGQRVTCAYYMTDYDYQRPPPQYPEDRPRYGYWDDVRLTIWKPDGTTETIGPVKSGEAGSGFTYYTPTMVGTYILQWEFKGQTIELGPRAGDYYKPCTSVKMNLTVQEEPIEYWPIVPLPTGYWEAPIYGDKHNWVSLAGNWLWGEDYHPASGRAGGYNPYATAPNSAHILWAKQDMAGGIIEAELGPQTSYTGRRPANKFGPPVIISNRLYINIPGFGEYGSPAFSGFKCLDLYTGETIWEKKGDGLYITNGQVNYFWSVAQEGVFPYLWNTDDDPWKMYDAWTGDEIATINDVISGTNTIGENGEIMRYQLNGRYNWLTCWNSSQLLLTKMRAIGVAIDWTPVKGDYNYSEGLQWNKTLTDVPGNPSLNLLASDLQLIIASNTFPATTQYPNGIRQELAYSIKPGQEGQILWVQNRTDMFDVVQGPQIYADGYYWKGDQATLQWYIYDAATGKYIGKSEPNDRGLSIYSMSGRSVLGNNTHFNTGYDGTVRAWDQTGKLLWEWYAGSSGFETPYGSWPLQGSYTGPKAADGKVFVINSEHTPMSTLWRGGQVYAINASTGEEVWSISGTQAEASSMGIGWGYLVYLNGYDSKIYCFGKGPSATTVSAPQIAITQGQSIMITGTVTDQSPGQKGSAAVSDASMKEWMEYLHMQQPIPTNATGVEVILDVVDANGNCRNIGTVTTDISGTFGYMWEPDIPGQYTLVATFPGTESYGGSWAQTYFGVVEAPAATPEPTPTPAPMTDTYVLGIGAAAIIAIVAIGIILILMLRKR